MKVQFTSPKQLKASLMDLNAGTTFVYDLSDDSQVFMLLNKESVLQGLNVSDSIDGLVCFSNIETGEFYYRVFTDSEADCVYIVKPTIIPEFRTIDALDYEHNLTFIGGGNR